MKPFEVNAETIGDALVGWLPEIEVAGTASNGKMETSRDSERHYLPNYLRQTSSYWVPHWPG